MRHGGGLLRAEWRETSRIARESASQETFDAARELVYYRRAGGMVGLDQRLTVFTDGRVVLEDRKSRSRCEVAATTAEIDRLIAVLDQVPATRWHSRLATIARTLLPHPHESMRFELRRGGRWISGHAGAAEADLAPLLAELDELLARAVREGRG